MDNVDTDRARFPQLRRHPAHTLQEELWSKIPFPRKLVERVLRWFEQYQDDLRMVNEYQRELYAR